jgi:hypothetical protein
MNTEHAVFHLSETASSRPKSQTKPASGGAASFELIVWIAGCLVIVLGLLHAAQSEQPLLWLAVWPAPVALACTIFTFIRQGFHFEDRILVLGQAAARRGSLPNSR